MVQGLGFRFQGLGFQRALSLSVSLSLSLSLALALALSLALALALSHSLCLYVCPCRVVSDMLLGAYLARVCACLSVCVSVCVFVSVCYLTYSCGHTSHALDLVEMQQLNETEYKMPLRNLQNFVSPAPARPRRA